MGRGRQKAKQQKIARKLKYLTTDTNYDELAKELGVQESDVEDGNQAVEYAQNAGDETTEPALVQSEQPGQDDLDEYAKWAAEAAAKATSGELPSVKASAGASGNAKPRPHKPIPMPVPNALKAHKKD